MTLGEDKDFCADKGREAGGVAFVSINVAWEKWKYQT